MEVEMEISDEVLAPFQALVDGGVYPTLGDALRAGLNALEDRLNREAIQEGIEDEKAGQLLSAREVLEELQTKHR